VLTGRRALLLLRRRSGDDLGWQVNDVVDEFKRFLDDASPDQFAAGNE
jgi:hypothetical protein